MTFIIVILFCYYSKTLQYFPFWAEFSKNNKPINVRDTNSALGKYSKHTKKLYLKDLVLAHGHLCDGLVISFLEIKAVLNLIFPDGNIDRTDILIVSKNGPCWIDTASIMTGARVNFGTLSIDNKIENGYIIKQISTKKAFKVSLKENVFPTELKNIEKRIRNKQKSGIRVTTEEINKAEREAEKFNKFLLNCEVNQILNIEELKNIL